MVSASKHISDRKYSIKQLSHFSALLVINSHTLSPIKFVNFEYSETNAAKEAIYFLFYKVQGKDPSNNVQHTYLKQIQK